MEIVIISNNYKKCGKSPHTKSFPEELRMAVCKSYERKRPLLYIRQYPQNETGWIPKGKEDLLEHKFFTERMALQIKIHSSEIYFSATVLNSTTVLRKSDVKTDSRE